MESVRAVMDVMVCSRPFCAFLRQKNGYNCVSGGEEGAALLAGQGRQLLPGRSDACVTSTGYIA